MKLFKKAKDSLLKKAKKKSKKKSAVATLEFVLVIPFVLVLFLMSLEFSFIMIEKHLMLSALYSAGREATRSLQEYSFGEHPKAGFVAFRNNLDLPVRDNAEWQCHNWSDADNTFYKSSTGSELSSANYQDQKQMCEKGDGRIFTGGNNVNHQGCGSCLCCKKRTDDSTAHHDYNHIFINPSDPNGIENDPNIDITDPNFDATHVSYDFGSFLGSPDPVKKPYACLPVFPDLSKIRQTYSCNAFSLSETNEIESFAQVNVTKPIFNYIETVKTKINSTIIAPCAIPGDEHGCYYSNYYSAKYKCDRLDNCAYVVKTDFLNASTNKWDVGYEPRGDGRMGPQKRFLMNISEGSTYNIWKKDRTKVVSYYYTGAKRRDASRATIKEKSICQRKGGYYSSNRDLLGCGGCSCCTKTPMSVLIKEKQEFYLANYQYFFSLIII